MKKEKKPYGYNSEGTIYAAAKGLKEGTKEWYDYVVNINNKYYSKEKADKYNKTAKQLLK